MPAKLSACVLTSLLLSSPVMAADVEAYFDGSTGKLVIPHLTLNDSVFYATLSLTDGNNLVFQADPESLVEITRPALASATVNTSSSQIVGTWTVAERGVDELRITFNADGTYDHFEIADDPNCVTGAETGHYVWEPSTGLLIASVAADSNKECGLSHPRDKVPLRFFIEGDAMQILEKGDLFGIEEFALIRVGG